MVVVVVVQMRGELSTAVLLGRLGSRKAASSKVQAHQVQVQGRQGVRMVRVSRCEWP